MHGTPLLSAKGNHEQEFHDAEDPYKATRPPAQFNNGSNYPQQQPQQLQQQIIQPPPPQPQPKMAAPDNRADAKSIGEIGKNGLDKYQKPRNN